MSILNYRVPSYQFLIGAIDYTAAIARLTISPGISETENPLIWSGDFEIAYTKQAIDGGVDEDSLSELATPDVWRPGLEVVSLNFFGFDCFKLRIADYHYEYTTHSGRGQLTQILETMSVDRPAEEVTEIKVGAKTLLSGAVNYLLLRAGQGSVLQPQIDIDASLVTGSLDVPLLTRDGVKDAQRLAGINWCWLVVDGDETIKVVKRPERGTTPLLIRSRAQLEDPEPNLDNINFAASKIIVSGSRQVPVPYVDDSIDPDEAEELVTDSEGRTRFIPAISKKPAGVVFPQLGTNTTEIIAERKSIWYLYRDGKDHPVTSLPLKVQQAILKVPPQPDAGLAGTVTRKEQPSGAIFRKLGTSQTLRDAEIIIESDKIKQTFKPFGVIFPREGANFEIYSENLEELQDGASLNQLYKPRTIKADIAPLTGKPAKVEKSPDPEPPQPAPQFELETEQLKGITNLQPVGWDEFLPTVYVRDMGFLPSQFHALNLSRQIGYREVQRRDSLIFKMPLPREWCAAGCPHFAQFNLIDGAYLVEQPVIDLDGTTCSLTFQGDRLGSIPAIPDTPDPAPIFPTNEAELIIIIPTSISATAGVAITPVQVSAVGGDPPYVFSAVTLPTGLSISSGGLISGAPSTAGYAAYTIDVVDDSAATASRPIPIRVVAVPSPVPPVIERIDSVGTWAITGRGDFPDALPLVQAVWAITANSAVIEIVESLGTWAITANSSIEDVGGGGY
jgi:Putative Ig domain